MLPVPEMRAAPNEFTVSVPARRRVQAKRNRTSTPRVKFGRGYDQRYGKVVSFGGRVSSEAQSHSR